MCTLTLIKKADQIILTHNRDENINRPSPLDPQWHIYDGQKLWYPKDEKGGGTWMACSEDAVVCLLNGGFEKHEWAGPYRHSRGLVPLAALAFKNTLDFVVSYDFSNLEPFTIVHINSDRTIYAVVWDGKKVHTRLVEEETAIWSSSTLYSASIRADRSAIFQSFLLSKAQPSPEEMVNFHNIADVGNTENNLIMKRESGVQTLSIFQVALGTTNFEANYLDLQTNNDFFEAHSQMA